MFRKEFFILGVIFGCFMFGSMAFPGGVVESSANGSAHVPTVASVGGWVEFGKMLAVIGLGMGGTILLTGIGLMLMRMRILRNVAEAWDVDVDALKGKTPMEAALELERVHREVNKN